MTEFLQMSWPAAIAIVAIVAGVCAMFCALMWAAVFR